MWSRSWASTRRGRGAHLLLDSGLHIARTDTPLQSAQRGASISFVLEATLKAKDDTWVHDVQSLRAFGVQDVDVEDSVPRHVRWTLCAPLRRDGARHVCGHADLHAAGRPHPHLFSADR